MFYVACINSITTIIRIWIVLLTKRIIFSQAVEAEIQIMVNEDEEIQNTDNDDVISTQSLHL
uniref:Uncharacterized protein n=1 Tax=Pristionchus pacificus TaxID=54126 RepID=A0A2A6CUJ8_PRIPA|eukprot:PDM81829.1 hypothetical protein PRIPAC_33983 [Pristionchus pacificus]